MKDLMVYTFVKKNGIKLTVNAKPRKSNNKNDYNGDVVPHIPWLLSKKLPRNITTDSKKLDTIRIYFHSNHAINMSYLFMFANINCSNVNEMTSFIY